MKHPGVPGNFRCADCDSSLCPSCTYGEHASRIRCHECHVARRAAASRSTPTDRFLRGLFVVALFPVCAIGFALWFWNERDWTRVSGRRWLAATALGAVAWSEAIDGRGDVEVWVWLAFILGYGYFLSQRIRVARQTVPSDDLVTAVDAAATPPVSR